MLTEIGILSSLLDCHCRYYTIFMTVFWVGDPRPCHRECAVHQWSPRLTVCVKATGEHFERSW